MDIDIDFYNRDQILELIEHRTASLDGVKKHNTGVYVTEIPHNPVTNQSTIDYKTAEQRGYFKIDFLNVNVYKNITSEDHLVKLINQEPVWELLEHQEFVDQIFHISGHSDVLKKLKPKNVEQLAAVLAIIRPSKRYLADADWNKILNEVWTVPDNEQYYFKKAHGIAYAMTVVVHMNLLCEQLTTVLS